MKVRWMILAVVVAALLGGVDGVAGSATDPSSCGNNKGGGAAAPVGDPVDAYSGNDNRRSDDLALFGGVGQHRLTWTRWANSRATSGALLFGWGHNWRHGYQWEIANTSANTNGQARLNVIQPDGAVHTFTQISSNEWRSTPAVSDVILQQGTNFWLQNKDGWRYHFDRSTNSQGTAFYLVRDFTDAQGNRYDLTYDAARRVVKVTEPAGRWLAVKYGALALNKVDFTPLATMRPTLGWRWR